MMPHAGNDRSKAFNSEEYVHVINNSNEGRPMAMENYFILLRAGCFL